MPRFDFVVQQVNCSFPEVVIRLDAQDRRYYVHPDYNPEKRLIKIGAGFAFQTFQDFNRARFLSFETVQEAQDAIKEIWG